ncbi:response regulator [Alphaproteobacteria bacterium KMM 3653]|uniref:Response regulator n=1 Tax=Harenicola maris TaxID=2841044 RepID=A0AAP2CR76_9RHOB|nr:response regulator [Harenicola maris]
MQVTTRKPPTLGCGDLAAPLSRPTAERPLAGLTVLVIEDSRFAADAIRLLCLRSGARIRRADSLKAAHRHLTTYCPDVIIADLGLPDGSGLDLIATLKNSAPNAPIIIATSGDDTLEGESLTAGADGFLPKPLASIAVFQQAILAHFPPLGPTGLRAVSNETVQPDPLALHDDLKALRRHLASEATPTRDRAEYGAQFLASLARTAGDEALENKVESIRKSANEQGASQTAIKALTALVTNAFGPRPCSF